MLMGHLIHTRKRAKDEDMVAHAKAVAGLSDHALLCIIADLRHSNGKWFRARRMAALDEAEGRGILK